MPEITTTLSGQNGRHVSRQRSRTRQLNSSLDPPTSPATSLNRVPREARSPSAVRVPRDFCYSGVFLSLPFSSMFLSHLSISLPSLHPPPTPARVAIVNAVLCGQTYSFRPGIEEHVTGPKTAPLHAWYRRIDTQPCTGQGLSLPRSVQDSKRNAYANT
jgi:hypothetical protein